MDCRVKPGNDGEWVALNDYRYKFRSGTSGCRRDCSQNETHRAEHAELMGVDEHAALLDAE